MGNNVLEWEVREAGNKKVVGRVRKTSKRVSEKKKW